MKLHNFLNDTLPQDKSYAGLDLKETQLIISYNCEKPLLDIDAKKLLEEKYVPNLTKLFNIEIT